MPSRLFEPLTLRSGARLENRLALAPLTNKQSHADGTCSDEERAFLVRRARGGFGVVETCAAYVSQDGKAWAGQLGIHDDAMLPGLTTLATALREAGALGLVQLYHGGGRASREVSGLGTWSASEWGHDQAGFEVPRAASEDDIARVIEDFCAGARRAEQAGFGGVELHGAHGYLLSQFLSSTMNRRDDGWGGSNEGRARLLTTILARVRRECPAPFVVGVRLSPEDFGFAKGIDLDETIEVAAMLADLGADFIHLSLWNAANNSKKRPDEHAVTIARERLPASVAIFGAGSVWTAADAHALRDRGADVVSIGRAAILNPDWPTQVRADPGFAPKRPPVPAAELAAADVSPVFVDYLRGFKNMVAAE